VFRTIRLTFLLGVLAFVALGAYLSRARTTDWDLPLWIAIHPINADGSAATAKYLDALSKETFAPIEAFMAHEAARYQVTLSQPVRVELYGRVDEAPPVLDRAASALGRALWSLRLRYWAWKKGVDGRRPPPDIRMFVLYHDPTTTSSVPHSLGLQKGLLGVVYAFADRDMTAANNIVIAHELLHTVGASDKYDANDDRPLFPAGYADPQQQPLYPQARAEVMAGRRMLSEQEWDMPYGLREVVVGPETAAEIHWIKAAE
jgi:hypothetical protein